MTFGVAELKSVSCGLSSAVLGRTRRVGPKAMAAVDPKAPRVEWEPFNDYEQKMKDILMQHFGARMDSVSEAMLARFIRGYAKEKDAETLTVTKLDEALKWRASFKVEELTLDELEGSEAFDRIWPHCMHGTDKLGHPVYYEKPGVVDPKELFKAVTTERVMQFHVQTLEHLNIFKELESAKRGTLLYKQVVILDLAGLGMKHASSDFTGPMRAVVDIDQFYYPESLHRMFIINAPFVFRAVWAMVKPWLHPITKERIQLVGDNYKEKLLDLIDADQLPKELGGACDCSNEATCPKTQQKAAIRARIEELKLARAARDAPAAAVADVAAAQAP